MSGYSIIEVDGAPTANGRLPVSANLEASGIVLKVSAPIMKTKHYVDSVEVEFTPTDTEETLYKTYTHIAGKYLRELMVAVEKKETILYVYIDGELYSEINAEISYDHHHHRDEDQGFSQYFSVNKNKKNFYTFRFLYDNTPVNTSLELKIKYSNNNTKTIKMNHVIIVYNEVIV